jgi:hypothetical protein
MRDIHLKDKEEMAKLELENQELEETVREIEQLE